MHEMRILQFMIPRICQSVCHAHSRSFAAAIRIEVLLRVETLGDTRNIVLDESPDFPHGFGAAFAKLLCHLLDIWATVII